MTSIVPSGGGGGSSIVGLESVPYTYLPNGWDIGWKAAKAAALSKVAPASIMFFGDSIASGAGGVSDWKKTYPHLMRESLRTTLGGLRSDYFPSYGLSLVAGGAVAGVPPWSAQTAGTTSGRNGGLSWHSIIFDTLGAQAGYMQTFTSPEPCNALDLFYLDYNSGTWSYSLDGAGDIVVTCTNATNPALAPTKVISLTGLSTGIHTLAVGKQSALSVCLPVGVTMHNTGVAGGIQIARFLNSNATMSTDYVTTGQIPNTAIGRLELLAGLTPSGGGGTGTAFGFPMQPHLLIHSLNVNDCGNSASQSDYAIALRRMIQAVRKGRPNASIIFHIICNPDATSSDNTSNLFHPENWAQWMIQTLQFAEMYCCGIVFTHARWGETPNAQGFLSNAQNVHPLDAGHADIATTMLGLL